MSSLILGLSKKKPTVPREFWSVVMCKELHCTYTELVSQPKWWLDLYELYLSADAIAEQLRNIGKGVGVH